MIIVKLWGGIGNQLFQYAFGKYLSSKFNTEVKPFTIQTNLKITLGHFGKLLLLIVRWVFCLDSMINGERVICVNI